MKTTVIKEIASRNCQKLGTRKIIITKSLDPRWPKFAVIIPDQFHLTQWFDSEKKAHSHACSIASSSNLEIILC
jgi:hypothetical protein